MYERVTCIPNGQSAVEVCKIISDVEIFYLVCGHHASSLADLYAFRVDWDGVLVAIGG